MENFAYIDKNVYINILILILKNLKDYLLGIGIFKLIFCLFIIVLSIIFAKRSKKKKKKINVYLQINRNNTKHNESVINDEKILYNDEEKTNDHHKEEKEIENEAYHITHSSHIFDLKIISTTELCSVCNDNIYAFIFNKKNIFECVICKNKCHIECAPNSNLVSCKSSIFFKNKHKFIKIKNSLWNGKCDICNKNLSYFSFSIYDIKYIYKCIWCNKYFHGKCINKSIHKKINNNNNNNGINMKNDDLICTYGNNKFLLYPHEIFIKEKYLLYFLVQSYQKTNKTQIQKDDILLSYNETQLENYTCEDELVVEKEIGKFSIQMLESDKNRELIHFNYLSNAKKYQSLISSKVTENDNNNNPVVDKQNHTIHINMLLNFLPIHIPIYEINSQNKILLIFVNVRSGGQTGKNLYRELLVYFNPLQIINIENESSVVNTLHMYKEMLYQKKVIIFLCGGDGTISIFIDTLIKFFCNNAPFNIYEEKEKFPKKKIQKKKIYHITENANKISNKAITLFNKYIMATSKGALKKSDNNTSKMLLNKERDETKCDIINNCSDTNQSKPPLENENIDSLIEDKNNMSNECEDDNNNNNNSRKINNIVLKNGTNIYSDLYKNYDDNIFINRGAKTDIGSDASLSNESISYMSPFPNSDSMCNGFRKSINKKYKKKYVNLLENLNIYQDEKDAIYIDHTLKDSHINKSFIEKYNNSYSYISGYSNKFIDINKPWNNSNSYIYSRSLKKKQNNNSIKYHEDKENEIEHIPTETQLHNNNSSYYKENDIKNDSMKYDKSSSDEVHSNYQDDQSSDTSESLDEEEIIQKKNKETQTKTKKWLKYISKESEKIHNKFIKRNISKIQERFNLSKSQENESDNSLYKFHKNGNNKCKIINKKKHEESDSINDNTSNNSTSSNNTYTVKSYIASTPIAIIPLGTGNDLCISLGWGKSYINNISLYLNKIEHSKKQLADVWSIKAYDLGNNIILNNTFINYFDIGLISRIALHFDNIRKQFPHLFNSRLGNKLLYGEVGFRDFLLNTYRYKLNKQIKLYCDGKRVKINQDVESICFINIPYILGGHNIWKDENLQYCYYSDIEKGYDENETDQIKNKKKLTKKVKKKNVHNNKSTNTQIHTCDSNYENNSYTQSLKNKKNESHNDEDINVQREISKSCSYKYPEQIMHEGIKENIKHIDDETNTTDYSNIYKPHKSYLYKRKKNFQVFKKQQIDDKLIEVFGIKNMFHLIQIHLGLSGPIKLCQGHELFIKISKKFIRNNKMYFQYDGEPVFRKIYKLHFTHKCQCLFLSPKPPIL